ncbi:hypothetical protein HOY82DRAFT_618601 [Tuber indicum]|nr:hypothetical protein HOY82DRAFT_618601 [Tuber indicum]
MSTSAPPRTSPMPETPTLLTAPEIPMTPHPVRVLRPSTPLALRRRVSSPIGRTPGSKRSPTSNYRFRCRLRASIIESPTRTLTPTSSPNTISTTSTTLPSTTLPSTTLPSTPTPPRRCTPSYTKAQTHIANLRSILSRVHALNLNPDRFSAEVCKSLAGIEWGLHLLLERGDMNQYLYLKKEGRGKGVWMDADAEGLVRRSGFWVRVWREVRGIVGGVEEEEEDRGGVYKRKREIGDIPWSEGESAKKGRYEEDE